ncbi:MAG: efflux transporter outer membrane subunit [Gammaproteobacteria bacterium]|nr:efflux transporter outer membrane subunit [Gammaproteobacteria bacterium]
MKKWGVIGILAITLTACSLAPKYQRPEMSIPDHYQEAGKWIPVNTTAADISHGPWWEIYQDQALNALESKVTLANQNLKLAFYRYQEARALAQVARSAYYPTILGIGNADRQSASGNIANVPNNSLFNDTLIGADFSYEVDVFGRVRNSVRASESSAKASAADLAAVNLSSHAELASDYFSLRGSEAQLQVLERTVAVYKKALDLTIQRHRGGAAPEADVDQAKTQYENAKTLTTETRLKIAQLQHAIAVLIGEAPADFTLGRATAPLKNIMITPYLPSTLLERRPDIAAAALRVEAANANIGVARAAFFPHFNLITAIGFESQSLSQLISMPSLFWSLGSATALTTVQPAASVVLFDGGKVRGLLNQANAVYFQTVAQYRQTVLTALQEVEDNLVAIHRLDQENKTQTAATIAARRALQQAQYRYSGGIATFLDIVVTENTALQAELASVDIKTRRLVASVQLIKALGGGWSIECLECLPK